MKGAFYWTYFRTSFLMNFLLNFEQKQQILSKLTQKIWSTTYISHQFTCQDNRCLLNAPAVFHHHQRILASRQESMSILWQNTCLFYISRVCRSQYFAATFSEVVFSDITRIQSKLRSKTESTLNLYNRLEDHIAQHIFPQAATVTSNIIVLSGPFSHILQQLDGYFSDR